MNPVTKKSMPLVKRALMDKSNSVVNIMSQRANGATELSRIYLGKTGKERSSAVKVLTGMIPEDSGKLFCTVS